MKASEIRKMSASELDTKLHDLKDELFKLRFQQAINQLDNPMRINAVKKDIAFCGPQKAYYRVSCSRLSAS